MLVDHFGGGEEGTKYGVCPKRTVIK